MLFRLIYYSENHLGAEEDDRVIPGLNAIMDAANRNNKRDGITGALLFELPLVHPDPRGRTRGGLGDGAPDPP